MTAASILTQLLREKLEISISIQQADGLWVECRSMLLQAAKISTIIDIEADLSPDQSARSFIEQDVLFAVGMLFAKRPWINDADTALAIEEFLECVAVEVKGRGYALAG